MKKIVKILILTAFIYLFIFSEAAVLAANLNVNIDFDGSKIEMTSETPEMEWKIDNLLPDESREIVLTVNSIGKKEIKIALDTELIEGREFSEKIQIKIINKKTNEILYEGNFSELNTIIEKIPAKETRAFKVIVKNDNDAEDKGQGITFKIKFKYIATGEKEIVEKQEIQNGNQVENQEQSENTTEQQTTENQENNENLEKNNIQENTKNQISTDVIRPIKNNESRTIYIVLGILVVILGILGILFFKTKR